MSWLTFLALMLADPAAASAWPQEIALDFTTGILPILSRHGCNQAECHGAALGQAGFKLSLFGNDPRADYQTITRELSGRRIDRADPARSLILLKPTRQLPHKGGKRFGEDSAAFENLLAWARRGFPFRLNTLEPARLEAAGEPQIRVTAWYSDGSSLDATHLAMFTSNDGAVAEVDREGRVSLKGPGETAIMVRFGGLVAAARAGKPFRERAARAAAAGGPAGSPDAAASPEKAIAQQAAGGGAVDGEIDEALDRMGIEPSGPCDDQAFLRRARLDLTGMLPTSDEARRFAAHPDRRGLIDALIAGPDFETYWAYQLGKWMEISSARMGEAGAREFHQWLRSRVRKPWPETARAILTAAGQAPESAFFKLSEDPRQALENLGRMFLGTRWMCAQCHDHPFERFRRTDYYGLAAMLARTRVTDRGVTVQDHGEIIDPQTGKPALPAFPDGRLAAAESDRRIPLAAWTAEHPQLRKAFANRIWALLFGRGLVQPVDDFRASNPPSHAALLDRLAAFETIPDLVRLLASSRAYQRAGSNPGNAMDRRFFSHASSRPLPAEVLVDAIAQATGVGDVYDKRPAGTRAIALGDAAVPSYTLDVCGRNRPEFSGSLAQELHLLNGDAIAAKLGGIEALLALGDEEIIAELYLRTWSRFPRSDELDRWLPGIRAASGDLRREWVEDFFWALLNSWEFQSCH